MGKLIEVAEQLASDKEALEYVERMAKLNSPNGDVYGGKAADEVLLEIDAKRTYQPSGAYDCPICGNKGGIAIYKKETRQVWWKACSCLENKKNLANVEKSGLGALLNYRVKDFKAETDYQKAMKDMTAHYLYHAKKEWFALLGQSGSGKTMLCSAICNQLLKTGHVVKYLIWGEFMTALRHMKYDEQRNEYYTAYLNAEVLYVDDLFKGKITDYERDIGFQIINHRYNHNLVTIISSEWYMSDLAQLDEAMASRIYQRATEQYLFEIERGEGKNYRLKDQQLQLEV